MDIFAGALAGLLIGAGIVYIWLQRQLSEKRLRLAALEAQYASEQKSAGEKLALLEQARDQLKESFQALSSEALSKNNESFLNLAKTTLEKYQEGAKGDLNKRQEAINKTVEPVGIALKAFNERVDKIEQRRTQTDASIGQQLQQLAESQIQLNETTGSLAQALRAPQVRGQWGEMQLRRTVEVAGMIKYCDFEEQASVETGDGQRQRPDMIIRLPNERVVVVDSKVPLEAYLAANKSADPDYQKDRMIAHARHVRDHIKGLSAKSYWSQFDNTPEFVVLFLGNEAIFSAALEQDPELIELGVKNKVILATPTTLIALLKAIAYGWKQEAVTRDAKAIAALGNELFKRISVFTDIFNDLGKSLNQSVGSYNQAVGSLEKRLLVSAKKFNELDSASLESLPESSLIEQQATTREQEQ
jgi:DNA recombination protein RmuC